MASKKTKHEEPAEPSEEQVPVAEAEPPTSRVSQVKLHPHEVELTREDREEINRLAQEKAKSGLPLEMALQSAETQVREDRCGLYARVRNAFNAKA